MVGTRGRLVGDAMAVARRCDRWWCVHCLARPACRHRRGQIGHRLVGCGAGPIRSRRAAARRPGRVRGRPPVPRRPQHRWLRNAVDTGDVRRVGVDHPVRQGGVARAGLAPTVLDNLHLLPSWRHSPVRPRRRSAGVDAGAHRRAHAGADRSPSQRCRPPEPVVRSRRPGGRRAGVSRSVHGDRSHRAVRFAELVAEPPRSDRDRSGGCPARFVRHRGTRPSTSSPRRTPRRCRLIRYRRVRPWPAEVAGHGDIRRRPSVRARRSHVLGRSAVRRVPVPTDVQPADRTSAVHGRGHHCTWRAADRRAGLHVGRPAVPRAGVRVRRRCVPARQRRRPVHLVAADRQCVRCGDRRRRRRDGPRAARPVANARDISPGAARRRRDGLLRSSHHAADRVARAYRRRRPALLPHHRKRVGPRAGVPRAVALARPRDPPAQRIPRPAVPRRAVDQFPFRRYELLRPQDDVDRDRDRGRVGGRRARQAPRRSLRRSRGSGVRGLVPEPVADRRPAVPGRADGAAGDHHHDPRLSLA